MRSVRSCSKDETAVSSFVVGILICFKEVLWQAILKRVEERLFPMNTQPV